MHKNFIFLKLIVSIFSDLGGKLYGIRKESGKRAVEQAVKYFTTEDGPKNINSVMRSLPTIPEPPDYYTDRDYFAVAATVLIQSYIFEVPPCSNKRNLIRMTGEQIPYDETIPLPHPTSFSPVEQPQFGHCKTILRTGIGRDISHLSAFPDEREVLLPMGYCAKNIGKNSDGATTLHSYHVALPSRRKLMDPNDPLYG